MRRPFSTRILRIASAAAAYPAWRQEPAVKRARIMFRFKALLEQNEDRIVALLTEEHGKVLADARGELRRGIDVTEGGVATPQDVAAILPARWAVVDLLVHPAYIPARFEGGEFVEFFGRKVPNSKAIETIAIRTSASIVFIYCTVNWLTGVYTCYATKEIDTKKVADEGRTITAELTKMTEEIIAKDPGRWLWSYKRWKFIPSGEDEKRYPFYARKIEKTDNEKDTNQKEG